MASGMAKEIWLTEDEITKLLHGDIYWDDVEEKLASERIIKEVEIFEFTDHLAQVAEELFVEDVEKVGEEKEQVFEHVQEQPQDLLVKSAQPKAAVLQLPNKREERERSARESTFKGEEISLDAERKMPWEYTPEEREMLWSEAEVKQPVKEEGAVPDWLSQERTTVVQTTLDPAYSKNELQQLLVDEAENRANEGRKSPLLQGVKLLVLMGCVAATTVGVWCFFLTQ